MINGRQVAAPTESEQILSLETQRAIEFELESICADPQFAMSQRNCAFLRYVVEETLAGRSGEIKERTLGRELFGRPITYDTGSDAVVRVRASEVRKRLSCYYDEHDSRSGWRIHLPLRTYVPVFRLEAQDGPEPQMSQEVIGAHQENEAIDRYPLPISKMMLPTLIALFLCAATFRWHVFSASPYLDFWETLLEGRKGIALILDQDPIDYRAVTTDDLELVHPIVSAASILHVDTEVKSSSLISEDNSFVPVHVTHRVTKSIDENGALILVYPGEKRELWIESTNNSALRAAIRSVADSDWFPPELQVAIRRKVPSAFHLSQGKVITLDEQPAMSRQSP